MLRSALVAEINDLVKRVGDEQLRRDLEQAVKKLCKSRKFGLVFEEHIPEVIALPGQPLEVGGWALRSGSPQPVQIISLEGDTADIAPIRETHTHTHTHTHT